MDFAYINETHRYITDLAISYANDMCQGENDKMFSRGSLSAAFMIGGERVLWLICNIIKESVRNGLPLNYANNLLQCIEEIAQMPLSDKQ